MGDEYDYIPIINETDEGYIITVNGIPLAPDRVVMMLRAATDIQANVHQIKIFAGAIASRFEQEFNHERL